MENSLLQLVGRMCVPKSYRVMDVSTAVSCIEGGTYLSRRQLGLGDAHRRIVTYCHP